ncbi:MAG: hypothetical protein PHW73_14725 [Atribacterota bacterium]|nr:hypothetical protein [Atribacterota bacterium]
MPYIKKDQRNIYSSSIENITSILSQNKWKKGDFNYCISMIINAWVKDTGLSYDTLSNITGVLNDIKTEFERKVVAPYENKKIEENGEVYD